MTSSSAITDTSSIASPVSENSLAVKAAYKNSIVSFRTPRDVAFDEVRRRLYEKFVNQEKVPLSKTFSIAYMLPATMIQSDHVDPARARCRSDSLSPTGVLDQTQMRFVTSQVEWEMVVASAGRTKISLRVFEPSDN
jgi:hypothetical protein